MNLTIKMREAVEVLIEAEKLKEEIERTEIADKVVAEKKTEEVVAEEEVVIEKIDFQKTQKRLGKFLMNNLQISRKSKESMLN